MNNSRRQKTEQLCLSAIQAAIGKLCQVGVWPRPPAAKLLRAGYEFYRGDLESVQEVTALTEYLASDQRIQSIYFDDPSNPSLYILYEYWERLLTKILFETEGDFPSKKVFRKWFNRFLSGIYSDTMKWRIVDTIDGLKLTFPRLILDNSTVLTSLGAVYWTNKILEEYNYNVGHNWIAFGSDEASVVTTKYVSKLTNRHSSFNISDIERHHSLIETIRLIKPGVPRIHGSVHFQLGNFPISDPLAYVDPEGDCLPAENSAILDLRDVRKIKSAWRERMDTRRKKSLPIQMRTAYNRFFSSYGRKNLLETVLDLTIALEALLSPDTSHELSHRIALRAAWLLSTEKQTHNTVKFGNKFYQIVRTMYDIRSKMVHGGTPQESEVYKWIETLSGSKCDSSTEWKLAEQAKEEARLIVRKALNACYRLSKLKGDGPKWPLPSGFDENIVTAGKRRGWQKLAGIRS